jgi:hypothetical protein
VSSAVQHVTRHALLAHDFRTISNTFGITAVLLLLVLLLGRELIRAAGGAEAERRLRALTITTVPLFLCFTAVVAARFVYLIIR